MGAILNENLNRLQPLSVYRSYKYDQSYIFLKLHVVSIRLNLIHI